MPNEKGSKEFEKKPTSNLLIIVLALVVLLGAGGAGAYFMFLQKPAGTSVAKEKEQPVDYAMNTFLVNLADPGSKRFLKLTMVLELTSKDVADECKTDDSELRDRVLTVLSSQESDAIVAPEDKLRLKKLLMKSLNNVLTKGQALNIYFTDFLIQ